MNDQLKQMVIQNILEEQQSHIEVWHPSEIKYFGPDTRAISLCSEITSESVLPVISQLLHLEELSPEDQITLYLNTEGGSLVDALALYDTIKQISCPVIVIATGLCASAGLIILAAADYALASDKTLFFYHQPIFTQGPISSSSDMKSLNLHYEHCAETADEILKKKTKMRKSVWNSHFKDKTSFYFTVSQALEFNFIDKVLPKRKLKFNIIHESK